jgi:hypothetical protein
MKRLKFSEPLPKLILEGKKYATWRINDDKNLVASDIIALCHSNGMEFARAVIETVEEKTFGDLTDEDKLGHEEFASDEEMYKTYSKYYRMNVTPRTKLKIIKFKLMAG